MKVITDDDGCDCGCDGSVGIQPSTNPADAIIVRSKPGIAIGNIINAFQENGKKVYELDDFSLVKPHVTFTEDAGITEVGNTVGTVHYSGSITVGTYPIASRSISPDPGGLDLTAPFTFTKTAVKRTTPGLGQGITVSATDNQGNITSVLAGVPFKDAYYQGFNNLPTLDQAAIKALSKYLVDNILAQFGGQKSYVVPSSTPKYIYFSGIIGSTPPASAVLNGLPLPLVNLTPVAITNIYDGSLTPNYWVVRTANRFNPGTYLITLF